MRTQKEGGVDATRPSDSFVKALQTLVHALFFSVLALGWGSGLHARGVVVPPFEAPSQGAQASKGFAALSEIHPADAAQIRLLPGNVTSWWTRWKLLNQAQVSIDVTYFIISDDVFGLSFLGLLAKKAREGVKVRMMLDSRGSKSLSSVFWGRGYLKELSKHPNVSIRVYNPMTEALLRLPKDLRHAVASNHDKILIVDGEHFLTGGRNVGQEYYASPKEMPRVFRDTDIYLQGQEIAGRALEAFSKEFLALKADPVGFDVPARTSRAYRLELARQMMEAWLKRGEVYPDDRIDSRLRGFAHNLYRDLKRYPSLIGIDEWEPQVTEATVPTVLLDKRSMVNGTRNEILEGLVRMLDAAQDYVLVQNPYITLTRTLGKALERASKRGVRLIFLTNSPKSTDKLLSQAWFLKDWKKIMQAMPTLEIYSMSGIRPIHAKVVLIDDQVSFVGSYNFDPLSQAINSEIAVVFESPELTKAHREFLTDEMQRGRRFGLPGSGFEDLDKDVKGLGKLWVAAVQRMQFLRRFF